MHRESCEAPPALPGDAGLIIFHLNTAIQPLCLAALHATARFLGIQRRNLAGCYNTKRRRHTPHDLKFASMKL